MLTGWEVGYWTDDQHVKDLGVWIDEWSYSVGATGGTLRYNSRRYYATTTDPVQL